MKNITILGSTGSIGVSTLSVIKNNPSKFTAYALVANKNVTLMTKQCLNFCPVYACMIDVFSANQLKFNLNEKKSITTVLSGIKSACELTEMCEVDIVVSAIVGITGLTATLSAIRSGKRILLANKESIVSCGKLFMKEVHRYQASLLPIDSEHNAIFQILPEAIQHQLGYCSLEEHGVSCIILTGSGGPFIKTSLKEMEMITPKQACIHPNWSMGKKISVDSATMMNKGLEYIEARLLFNATPDQIEILLHPQSIIHSMVRYKDGSVLAQLGLSDMCIPIAHAMSYPKRIYSGVPSLNFLKLDTFSFDIPDFKRYPCLKLAIDASKSGQTATTALNAANEIAVSAFLNGDIRFVDIAIVNQKVLEKINISEPNSIDEILYIDKLARKLAKKSVSFSKI